MSLMVILFSALFGCSLSSSSTISTGVNLDYSDFMSLRVSDPYMQLNMSDDPYYLYFYSETCEHCIIIKPVILLKMSNLEIDQIYLVETNSLADIFEEINVTSTPTLVYIVNHQVVAIYAGQTEILQELENIS